MVAVIAIEQQGSLLAVANHTVPGRQSGGGSRGQVYGFSKASRARLIRKMSRLEPKKITFVTLTYPARFPRPDEAKTHLRALLERFRRRYPDASAIWRMEYQERGAPHFHLLFFELPYVSFRELKRWWSEIVSQYVDKQRPFVRIEAIKSKRGGLYYVSKYCAKMSACEDPNSSFFNLDAYLHAGRVWGCWNASKLPYAPMVYTEILSQNPRAMADVKKVMRRYYSRMNKSRHNGGVLLTDVAAQLNASLIKLMLLYGDEILSCDVTP